MGSEHQKVVILNNQVMQNAKLLFNSYSDYSKDVELILFSCKIGEYKFQDGDFYTALFGLRAILESKDIVICINGCRIDFVCSGMSQQMSQGKVGYIIEMGKKGTNKARTFDNCNDQNKLATVEQQIKYIKQWQESF